MNINPFIFGKMWPSCKIVHTYNLSLTQGSYDIHVTQIRDILIFLITLCLQYTEISFGEILWWCDHRLLYTVWKDDYSSHFRRTSIWLQSPLKLICLTGGVALLDIFSIIHSFGYSLSLGPVWVEWEPLIKAVDTLFVALYNSEWFCNFWKRPFVRK